MAISTIKAGLDDIAQAIRIELQALRNAKARIQTAYNNLDSLPTIHAIAIAEIQGLGSDISDELYKDELIKLTAEFIDLRSAAQVGITALASITEY